MGFLDGAKELFAKVVSKVPIKGEELARDIDPELSEHKYEDSFFAKAGGGVGGGLLGYKLGSNFGTLGKIVGGVVGVWAGSKLGTEIAADYGATKDYCAKNNDAKFAKTFASNLFTIGQKFDGVTNDSEPDV